MQCVEITAPGGPEVLHLVERPDPSPSPGDVLIRVLAAGVNRPDLLQRQGRYPLPPDASPLPGLEVAGEIAALGAGVSRWRVGERVVALTNGGGYATLCTVPAGQCLPWPGALSALEAAALPEGVFTVYANLFEAGGMSAGKIALIHGGASGIGTTAIQMCKAAGATAFVTVGTDAKAEACLALGAVTAIDYRSQDFVAEITRLTDNKGVDVVLDMVGGDYLPRNLKCLAFGGRHVSIATQHGMEATLDLRLVMQKQLNLTGSMLRPRSRAEKARLAAALETIVWPWIAKGQIKPLIYKTFSLKNADLAHAELEAGHHIGKIVLDCGSDSG